MEKFNKGGWVFNKGDFVWFLDNYTFDPEVEAGVVVAIKPLWCHIIPTGEVEPVLICWDDVYNDREEAARHRWRPMSP